MRAVRLTVSLLAGLLAGMWVVILSNLLAGYTLDRGFMDAAALILVTGIGSAGFVTYIVAKRVYRLLP